MAQELWQEVCLMAIAKQGGDDIDYSVITDTIDFGIADRPVESAKLINGGRMMLWSPEEDTEISFECYPLNVGTQSGETKADGVIDLKYETSTTSGVTESLSTLKREKVRVAFMWFESLPSVSNTVTSATDASPTGEKAKRFVFADGNVTAVSPDYSDKQLKYNVTVKLGVRDQDANPNMMFEACDGSASNQLAALDAYTESNKFRT